MAEFLKLLVITTLVFYFHKVAAESRTNFKLRRFELCLTGTLIKLIGNVSDEQDGQYLNLNVVTPVSMDANIGIACVLESVINVETLVPIFTIREKNFCSAANKYMGEFWYDILRAAQLMPGACPIPAGRYHVHHAHLNFRKISLQTFPFGRIRLTFNWFDNRKPAESLLCLLIEVDNIPN